MCAGSGDEEEAGRIGLQEGRVNGSATGGRIDDDIIRMADTMERAPAADRADVAA